MYLVVFKFLRFLNSRKWKVKVKVAQCVWLCDPGQNTVVGSLPLPQGIFPTRGSNSGLPHCGFFTRWATREAQEYWSGLPIPSPGDLQPRDRTQVSGIDPEIEPRSPALRLGLPAELHGKPKNTGVGSLSLLQQIFPTQESNWGLLHCRRILYQLSREARL